MITVMNPNHVTNVIFYTLISHIDSSCPHNLSISRPKPAALTRLSPPQTGRGGVRVG
jgi:hypothetical protein